MNYEQALRYLNSFINFEKISVSRNRRWNLDRTKSLLRLFGHPEKNYFTIIIAGTKGKGSTGYFLESILTAASERTGFYTSPHLIHPRERIRINGKPVAKKIWCEVLSNIRSTLNRHPERDSVIARQRPSRSRQSMPQIASSANKSWRARNDKMKGSITYFEVMTLMALLAFKKARIKTAILEVGMGGRLDATNAFDSKLAVLTPVHLDHEAILGNSITKIAREKAFVIKPRASVVVGPQPASAGKVIRNRAAAQKADLLHAVPANGTWKVGLPGDFQKINAGMAVEAVRVLNDRFSYSLDRKAVRRGLKSGNWPGRYERLSKRPFLLIDAAHNLSSIQALVRNLKRDFKQKDRILIFSANKDKNAAGMLKILRTYFQTVVITKIPGNRGQEMTRLIFEANRLFPSVFPVPDTGKALCLARSLAGRDSLIVATGSFYLIGEIAKKERAGADA